MAASVAAANLPHASALAQAPAPGAVPAPADNGTAATTAFTPTEKGYGTDPDLAKFYAPGDVWPLTLSEPQRKAAIALADLIFPADHLGPAASELRVTDYIDEWISAPYALQKRDREIVLPGLQWLDDEARKRFSAEFAALKPEQQGALADDICWPADAKPEFKKAALFFTKFRALAASAYYSTEPGWKALGYVGNMPLAQFDGPPPEVLRALGVEQTVK